MLFHDLMKRRMQLKTSMSNDHPSDAVKCDPMPGKQTSASCEAVEEFTEGRSRPFMKRSSGSDAILFLQGTGVTRVHLFT